MVEIMNGDNRTTARKPFLSALAGETATRPPFWFMRQAGRYLPEYRAVRARAGHFLKLCYTPEHAIEVTMQPIRRFHPDAAILFADILLIPHALGQAVDFREGEGPVLDPVRDVAALSRLGRDRFDATLAPVYQSVAGIAAALPPDVALIGFAGSPWTVATYMVEGRGSPDQQRAKRWAMGDPAGFGRLLDLLVDATVDYLSQQVAAGAEALQLFDTWAGSLPAGLFETCCIEPTRRIVAELDRRHPEIPVIGFPRHAGAACVDYAARTGIEGLGLDSSVHPAWAVGAVAPGVCLQGNLDPQWLAVGGQAMLDETASLLRGFAGRPHVFNLGHGINPDVPPENVDRLAAFVRDWRG